VLKVHQILLDITPSLQVCYLNNLIEPQSLFDMVQEIKSPPDYQNHVEDHKTITASIGIVAGQSRLQGNTILINSELV
jgi:hypothetical protein